MELHRNKSKCYQLFEMKKYYMQNFICYEVWSRHLKHIHPLSTAFAEFFSWIIYSIKLNYSLHKASQILFIIHTNNNHNALPSNSRYFGKTVEILRYQKRKSISFRVTYQVTFMDKLQYPYDT